MGVGSYIHSFPDGSGENPPPFYYGGSATTPGNVNAIVQL
jgi:hypothetical protein